MSEALFHEKQSMFMFCGIHCLNNLFQSREFTKEQFDDFCKNLSPDSIINPHKSILGIGNYDVNCLMQALSVKNYELIWFDKRKDITEETISINEAFGFISNINSNVTMGFINLPIKTRHWISFRRLSDGNFYNLDSKLNEPKLIGGNEEFITYLKNEMSSNDKEFFIVIAKS